MFLATVVRSGFTEASPSPQVIHRYGGTQTTMIVPFLHCAAYSLDHRQLWRVRRGVLSSSYLWRTPGARTSEVILPRITPTSRSMPMPTPRIALPRTIELHKICIGSDTALREHRVVCAGSCSTHDRRCVCPRSRFIPPLTHFEFSCAAVCLYALP